MNTLVPFPQAISKRQLGPAYPAARRRCSTCARAHAQSARSPRSLPAEPVGELWASATGRRPPSRVATSTSRFPSRSRSSSSSLCSAMILVMATAPRADTLQPAEAASSKMEQVAFVRGNRSGQGRQAISTPSRCMSCMPTLSRGAHAPASWRQRAKCLSQGSVRCAAFRDSPTAKIRKTGVGRRAFAC